MTLTFDEPPAAFGDVVQVAGAAGQLIYQGMPKVIDDTVHQPLAAPATGAAGAYQVTWHVTSDDGHPVSGTFRFTVAGSSTTTASPQTTATSSSSSPSASASGSSPAGTSTAGGSTWIYWAGLVVLVVVVLGLLLSRARRARTGRNPS